MRRMATRPGRLRLRPIGESGLELSGYLDGEGGALLLSALEPLVGS